MLTFEAEMLHEQIQIRKKLNHKKIIVKQRSGLRQINEAKPTSNVNSKSKIDKEGNSSCSEKVEWHKKKKRKGYALWIQNPLADQTQ